MPPWLSGYAKGREQPTGLASEHELQLIENHIPVLAPGVPVFHDSLRGQLEHPAQRIIVGKAGLVFGDRTELAVEALDNVRRVYDFPDLREHPKVCVKLLCGVE